MTMNLSRNNSKINWKFIAIVVILVIVVLWIGWYAISRLSYPDYPLNIVVPTPSPQRVQVDTSDWQTYRNEEYGFEVRYPEDWEQSSQIASVHFERRGERNTAVEIGITSDQAIREACKTLLELNPKEKFIGRNAVDYTKVQDLMISGVPSVRFSGKLLSGVPGIPPFRYQEEVMVCKENNIFSFALLVPSVAQENEIVMFDQILSTFRFVDKQFPKEILQDRVSCEAQGGKWRREGLAQAFMCIFAYSDGGKSCTSSDECEGECLITDYNQTTGICDKDTSRFGCYVTIEDFRNRMGILCRD